MDGKLEKLMKKVSEKVDSAELFRIKNQTVPVNFEVNRLKAIDISETEGQALRVINNGKVGFSSSTGGYNLDLMIDKSIATSEFGPRASFDFPKKVELEEKEKVNIYDAQVVEKSIEAMISTGEDIIKEIEKVNRELRCDVNILKNYLEVKYLNSKGGSYSYQKTILAYSAMVQKTEEEDMLILYSSLESGEDNLNPGKLCTELIEKLKWGEKIVSVESGKMPVIFTPEAALVLILPLIMGLNGKMVLKKVSPLSDKKGRKMWSELFSLDSDGTIDFALGSAPFDDEGVKMKRLPLVERGAIKNFYYDLQTAGIVGVESTGNGLRGSIHSIPTPEVNNLIIPEGKVPFLEMVKDIKQGIIIDQVLGLGQGNIMSGAFSNNVQLGFKIENGKIVGRVKDVMIAGNALEELNNIVALGNKAKWISGKHRFPHIYLKSLSVSTKNK